jgi:hypothetical protein
VACDRNVCAKRLIKFESCSLNSRTLSIVLNIIPIVCRRISYCRNLQNARKFTGGVTPATAVNYSRKMFQTAISG